MTKKRNNVIHKTLNNCQIFDIDEHEFYYQKINEVYIFFKEHEYSIQALFKTYVPALLNQKFQGNWIDRCLKIREIGAKVTYEKMILLYGEAEGEKRWKNYRELQAYTNSQAYKGMSDEEFKMYNKSRAVTLENMIKKYGDIVGRKNFEKYCNKQAFTNSLDYYTEKYGSVGYTKWKEYNIKKSHSLEAYKLNNTSENIAFKKYKEYWESKSNNFYSNKASGLFKNIEEELNLTNVYYAPKTKEFGLYNKILNRYTFYDFVIPDLKYCIEFNGDVFHGNPKLYEASDTPNPFNRKISCKDMWKHDKIKNDEIISCGYTLKIVWESDYDTNPEKVTNEIIHEIKDLMNVNRNN